MSAFSPSFDPLHHVIIHVQEWHVFHLLALTPILQLPFSEQCFRTTSLFERVFMSSSEKEDDEEN